MGTNLGVLASLMQSMAEANNIRPWDVATRSMNEAETGLRQLQELKRQQETAARTRQFLQEHPELVLGQGGGSTIGSLQTAPGGPGGPGGPPGAAPMTQQQVMPGQPTPAPQMVPGGQDLSRYANVPPTGGGPIPPDVMGQVTPTVTAPQGIPTLATLGQPQGQMQALQNRFLLDLARTSPDAAMQVQQLMQGQQDMALKRDEQRLTMGTRIAEYIGRVAQGVTSPETLEQARQEMARVAPQAAAQLPQTYSKEAMRPFIEKALSVKDSATVRLETWKNQIEEQKIGIQLANAGYQGLGEGVTGILRGLTPEQVQQFGGRTSDRAIAYATEEEKKRKLGQAGEAERLKFELEQKQQLTLPLQDARKEDAGLFVSKGTGQTIPGTMPYGQVKQLQDEKDPEKGVIKLANLDEKKQLTTLKQLEPVLQQYADLVQYAYGTDKETGKKGPLADYTRSPDSVITAMYGQLEQTDPVFQAKRRALQGQLQSVVRGLGARGDLNEAELKAAQEMIANMDASMGLGLGLGVGAGGGGLMFGAKPSINIPDSPATGVALANELISTVNRRIGSILQHEGYSKTPKITLYTGPPAATTSGTTPPTTTTPAAAPAPTPAPAARPTRKPGEIPVLGGPGMPEQYLPAPGKQSQAAPAPAAPVPGTPTGRPTPPTATSTPSNDEAYRRLMQGKLPVPGKQSQVQTGRRGVELARASGIKVMDRQDIAEAVQQTGKTPQEVIAAARAKGYRVYTGGTAMV